MQLLGVLVFLANLSLCMPHVRSTMHTSEQAWMRMFVQNRDNHGCDAIIPSCGPKGQCCDRHDECYKRHGCRSNSWGWSWIPGVALFDSCARCNKAVLFCVTNIFVWPGPSECCGNGNCGHSRQ
ncbi:unnamed protein product [Adineta ricciae]|uniref:Uncharacterized protein n=1 Tax=Adineta ricciae TaxID=249248 RepID=A0A815AT13_ADIRI|nr:unnamed protein product [Adineta ricciae]CAF1261539.1 unnamed protein product [Adineta ricciae]